ncbi:MAG TPA: PAS domain S-box protein [Gemmatimonadaceae bacterium]|nr:PAS domain S-box protein [Gemmatimonadaceae bacterium]
MMDFLRELIYLSDNDPLWVTGVLAGARIMALFVVAVWCAGMIRGQGHNDHGPKIPLTWTWALIGWMIANALQLIVGTGRVLIVGHIRTGDQIGDVYRTTEIVIAISLAIWSVVAFWRWSHPISAFSDEGAFAGLAASFALIVTDSKGVIQLTTPALDELVGADEDELLNQNIEIIIPERSREAHRKGRVHYLETGESRMIGRNVKIDVLRRDGTEAPASIALSSAEVEGETWFIGAVWDRSDESDYDRDDLQDKQDQLGRDAEGAP